ncbi:hypothetical protein Dimus_010718, partial [Dionaea muscipula]
GKEKLTLVESHLPRQMEFAKSEAIKSFLESEDYKKESRALYKAVMKNGFELCRAHVRNMLEDDDELVLELEGLRPVPAKGFTPKNFPKLVKEPVIWSEEFSNNPMEDLSELEKVLVIPSSEPPSLLFSFTSSQGFPSVAPLPQTSSSTTPLLTAGTDTTAQDQQLTTIPSSVEPIPPSP